MPSLRPFTPDDVPAVAALRRRVFAVTRHTAPGEMERYIHDVFFAGPWQDPELTGWVSEDGGELTGFVGVIPRGMRQRGGGEVRAAVASQLMVAPGNRGVTGVLLVKAALRGPQDLLYADVANARARTLWERSGGSTAELYAFTWTLPLRPARHAAGGLGTSAAARAARLALRPLLAAVDAVAARRANGAGPGTAEPLRDPAVIADALPALAPPRAVYPSYDAASLRYLLDHAARRWAGERLQGVLVRDERGRTAGWALYLDGAGGTARVLQMAAAAGRHADVLRHLCRHAREAGAVALEGRMEPAFLDALERAECRWVRRGQGIIVHARDPALLAGVLRGEAMLSGLDGEWWLDF